MLEASTNEERPHRAIGDILSILQGRSVGETSPLDQGKAQKFNPLSQRLGSHATSAWFKTHLAGGGIDFLSVDANGKRSYR